MNKKPQALSMNSNPQSEPTTEAPEPEQTQTPMPQPVVIQCAIPEGMERLERRLRTLESIVGTQTNLLRTLVQNTDSNPSWQQMDALVKQMDGLMKQVAHLEKMAEQAGKPKEKHSWLSKLHLPKITLPTVEWPVVIMVLMMLAALVMVWLFLGRNLSGWMSLLR
jgi:uncharacterized coiled-coil protein SlyX